MPNADTRNKRSSSINIDLGWGRIFPNPDGTIDVNDRQHTAYKYSGSVATVGGVVAAYRNLMGVGI